MTFVRCSILLSLPLAVGCAQFGSDLEVDSDNAAVRGGNAVTGANFPGTARLQVTRPDDEMGMPQDPLECSGSVLAPNLVLTSALCVSDNVSDTGALLGSIEVGFGPDSTQPAGGILVDDIEIHRYFDETNQGTAQLAILHLATDAPGFATPVTINEATLAAFSGMVTLVGYGETARDIGLGSLRGAELPIGTISSEFFAAGNADTTACNGDSGGPVFATIGAGVSQIGVTQFISNCPSDNLFEATRVDRHAADFIIRYTDQFSGPCPVDGNCETVGCRTPDPDCPENACGWGNACEEDCPTRDWDCPLGSFAGQECENSGDCEENGTCIAALDDATFLYCAIPCDSAAAIDSCPTNTTCVQDQCVYGDPSPGSQGFGCAVGTECRSGICEDRICVNECDLAAPDCADGFTCGPSKVQPGTNVCLGRDLSGGGGFCQTGKGGGSAALLLAFLGLVAVSRRRRR